MRVYTVGYTGLKMDALVEKVREVNGVLVDCRYSPFSRAPVWQKRSFEQAFGNRYIHVKQFGNRNYRPADAGKGVELVDPIGGVEILRAYRFLDGQVDALVLMCACPEPAGCHRRNVANALLELGVVQGNDQIIHWRKDVDFKQAKGGARGMPKGRRASRPDPSGDEMLAAQQRLRDRALGLPPIGIRSMDDREDTLDLFDGPEG